ncbi:MAG TPA: hypothetical protein VGU63_07150 [Candidatus Acidoferrales bacterium]|nr:hypothetical protein [Candidatus Acidoferrales bacterium]
MSDPKLRAINTELDNLVSNLRGEVGEVITTWTILRFLIAQQRKLSSPNVAADMRNRDLVFISVLRTKMQDELIARLSELSKTKIGRLTFHFAAVKLKALQNETEAFRRFIQHHGFDEKRNYDLSHKELPERWSEHKYISIPYKTLLEGIARASVLMKKIDRKFLGPSAPYLWREIRKKRYSMTMNPPGSMYMILPLLNLSKETREKIIMQEMAETDDVWSEMETKVNGNEAKVLVCKKWGAILLDRIVCLDAYPLQDISQITFGDQANLSQPFSEGKPVFEQKEITAKYQAAKFSGNDVVFVPIRRLHRVEDGRVTVLCDLTLRLDAKHKAHLGEMKVGDVREFHLTVQLLVGYATETRDQNPRQ